MFYNLQKLVTFSHGNYRYQANEIDNNKTIKSESKTIWISVALSIVISIGVLLILYITIHSNSNLINNNINIISGDDDMDCIDSCCIFCNSKMSNIIQEYNFFNDSKYFVDMPLKQHPLIILNKFNHEIINNNTLNLNLKLKKKVIYNFIISNFDKPGSDITGCIPIDYIKNNKKLPLSLLNNILDLKLLNFTMEIYPLWKYLCRSINPSVYEYPERHSLIGMKYPQMMISGGRFREIYYWDSYWIIKGLLVCNMNISAKQTLENIMYLSKEFGHTLNGNRIYYQNRSQPPLLTLMMNLIYEYENNNNSFIKYHSEFLYILKQDYLWWMDKQSIILTKNNKKYLLNLYKINSNKPRPEGYVEDKLLISKLKNQSILSQKYAYSSVRAGAEAGWDFTSRWCTLHFCKKDMTNIDTLNIIPVELNTYFYKIEYLLSKFFKIIGDIKESLYFENARIKRLSVLNEFLYDSKSLIWRDWNIKLNKFVNQTTISNYMPLWVLPYNITLANITLLNLNKSGLIQIGGIATTLINDTQQWDWPNAWPPIQFIIAQICKKYNNILNIAKIIELNVTQTFINAAYIGWYKTHYMHEKYNVLKLGDSGIGGEYTPQTGFGWTNAVAFSFLYDYGKILTSPSSND